MFRGRNGQSADQGAGLTDGTLGAFRRGGQKFSVELATCLIATATAAAAVALERFHPGNFGSLENLSLFGLGALIAVLGSWRQAIRDERLPSIRKSKVKHEHITGWGFVLMALVVSFVLGLASWAASTSPLTRDIDAEWGVYVVFGLAAIFFVAALAPPIDLKSDNSRSVIRTIGSLVRPLGLLLSAIDSILVFAVAGSAGVTQKWTWLRYLLLFATLVPCGLLGYLLPPPLGLIPLGWGLVVAISISRRWAWIEDDRDVYMLNQQFGANLRVGFEQDLRDEALLSFMSMFFLIPLALMQAQEWGVHSGHPLFTTNIGHAPLPIDWLGYFGTELAKAAPFVDWAEVYQFHGDERFAPVRGAGEHVVFAMRVLIDLVFLAALLQALSISARNAKQMEMFKAGTLNRLDPFTEPREFRKLLQRGVGERWQVNSEALAKFPTYDPIRLAELSDPAYAPINLVAIELRRRDHSDDVAEFTQTLLERAFAKQKDPESIEEALNALRMSDGVVPPDDLDRVRIALNHRAPLNAARESVVRLISRYPPTKERLEALQSVLVGISAYSDGAPPNEVQDSVYTVRRVAVEALRAQVQANDFEARRLLETVAEKDPSSRVKLAARRILDGESG